MINKEMMATSIMFYVIIFREDLAWRLPELEHENSDNEILDSASSMSSESLDDRLGSVDSEGQ